MKNAKRIDFRITLDGKGIVNYDDSEQKWMFKDRKSNNLRHHLDGDYNNNNYAKKNFYKDSKGDLQYKLKISNNCLMHEVFKEDSVSQTTELTYNENIFLHYLANPSTILRGYLLMEKDKNSFKKKSATAITDAEDVNFSNSNLEVFSRSGKKNMEADKKDNTFFYKETTGDIEYKSEGSMNLLELQFNSLSDKFDRMSFNPDLFPKYKKILQMQIPNFNSELGYYILKTSAIKIPELGYLFSSENVVFLVKEFFTRLCKFNIAKRGGFARIKELQYRIVTDPIEAIFNPEQGWKTIKSAKDIDSIQFECDPAYVEENFDQSIALLKSLEDAEIELKKIQEETQAKKKKAKEELKAKKKETV